MSTIADVTTAMSPYRPSPWRKHHVMTQAATTLDAPQSRANNVYLGTVRVEVPSGVTCTAIRISPTPSTYWPSGSRTCSLKGWWPGQRRLKLWNAPDGWRSHHEPRGPRMGRGRHWPELVMTVAIGVIYAREYRGSGTSPTRAVTGNVRASSVAAHLGPETQSVEGVPRAVTYVVASGNTARRAFEDPGEQTRRAQRVRS